MSAPKALIVSDFPILARAMTHAFHGRYDVVAQDWPAAQQFASCDVELIVLDITVIGRAAARHFLTQVPAGTRAALCSLHRNEVEVYWVGEDGLTGEGEIPSLLSLPSPLPDNAPLSAMEQA